MQFICKQCGKNIDADSKFCTFCGSPVQSSQPQHPIESNQTIASQKESPILEENMEKICSHLEFLGYQLEKSKAKDNNEKDFAIASHAQRNNVLILSISPHIIMFKISLTTGKRYASGMDTFMNEANKLLVFAKIYYELDKNSQEIILRAEALYTSIYSKEAFGEFFEVFNNDVNQRLYKINNFDKLFLD